MAKPRLGITGIPQTGSGTFAGTPLDASGNPATLPAGIVPVWSASDAGITLAPAADGLSVVASAASTLVAGASFTLTVMATMPDGTKPTGAASVPILPPVVSEVASFQINQTA
jgi:hypothetical protein